MEIKAITYLSMTFLLLTVISYIVYIFQESMDNKQTTLLSYKSVLDDDLDNNFHSKDGLPNGMNAFPAVYFPDRSNTEGNCN